MTMPFEVPTHPLMLLRVPGKRPDTVLTVERQIYNVIIAEYTEPLYHPRQW